MSIIILLSPLAMFNSSTQVYRLELIRYEWCIALYKNNLISGGNNILTSHIRF